MGKMRGFCDLGVLTSPNKIKEFTTAFPTGFGSDFFGDW